MAACDRDCAGASEQDRALFRLPLDLARSTSPIQEQQPCGYLIHKHSTIDAGIQHSVIEPRSNDLPDSFFIRDETSRGGLNRGNKHTEALHYAAPPRFFVWRLESRQAILDLPANDPPSHAFPTKCCVLSSLSG